MTHILVALQELPKSELEHMDMSESSRQMNPAPSVDCYRIMIAQYTEMHKYQHVRLKCNVVWKLCIYYGKVCLFQNKINN